MTRLDPSVLSILPRHLDLVVRNPMDPRIKMSGVAELQDAFMESDLPIRVDVMEWARIPESFCDTIEEKYVVVQEGSEKKMETGG